MGGNEEGRTSGGKMRGRKGRKEGRVRARGRGDGLTATTGKAGAMLAA